MLAVVDFYLWYRYLTDNPFKLPTLGPEAIIFAPGRADHDPDRADDGDAAVQRPVAAHQSCAPRRSRSGSTRCEGSTTRSTRSARTLDVFLGYATFRDELGGNPRRGILFEGPPGTGKTYLAKAMAKQAGVPFLFISAPAFQSMWFGMTNATDPVVLQGASASWRARKGGAIGFIEEIDAIGDDARRDEREPGRDRPRARAVVRSWAPAARGMVNELLIQMQSFDQPPFGARFKARMIEWVNGFLQARAADPPRRSRATTTSC